MRPAGLGCPGRSSLPARPGLSEMKGRGPVFQRLVGTEGPVTSAHGDGDIGPVPLEELSGLERPAAQSCC